MNKRSATLTMVIVVVALATWLTGAAAGGRVMLPLFRSSILTPSTISGIVFDDVDGNGVQGGGEDGLPGVVVRLWRGFSHLDTTTTGSNGEYAFSVNETGDYSVRETNPWGYCSTTPDLAPAPITGGGQTQTIHFGDRGCGTIKGTVFNDLDGSGTLGPGEPGLNKVVVELVQGGTTVFSTTTAINGSYQFSSLWLDSYTVRETDPPDYGSSTPNQVLVTLTAPGQTKTVNFGDRGIGTAQGEVFDDQNGNWVQDPGEPGIAGVTINITQDSSIKISRTSSAISRTSSAIITTTTTDSSGWYTVTSLWLGDYTVEKESLPGYISITPNETNISLASPGEIVTENFGDQSTSSVVGVVFNDLDQNGSQDGGELGIGSAHIVLLGNGTRNTHTASDGSYDFADLPLGTYSVRETDPSGFASTTPNSVTVALTTPAQIETVNFGDYGLPGDIQGTVFDDLNGNYVQDAGESGLAGVTVELRQGSSAIRTTTTDGNGDYGFSNQAAGGYTVREIDPPGYSSTTANDVSVSLPPGGSATANFGDRGIGIVSGVVFDDVNGNGVQGAGESGLGSVTVELWQGGVLSNSTTTNGSGIYSFTSVAAGSYTARETDPPGYVSTTPNDVAIAIASGGSATANFGDQGIGTVSGVVFSDINGNEAQDIGESGLGSVTVELWQGGVLSDATTTNGGGVYSFGNVTQGSYTVRETDPPGYVSTTPNDVVAAVAANGSATANFGDQEIGVISGVAFGDFNGDGAQTTGEGGIAGIVIELWEDSSLVASQTTNISGTYSFSGVTSGNYDVKSTRPAGFINTTPSERTVFVAPGGSGTANFGFQQAGTIGGVTFNDANGNGSQGGGENGIGGVAITLTMSGGAVHTATTAGDGSYLFSGVITPGNHTVSSAEVADFVRTSPGSLPVLVTSGGAGHASFGFQGQGTVSGVAFDDLNGNGIQDSGENGIGGVAVTMTLSTGGISATISSGDGSYSFDNVPQGSHTVETALPVGFARTTISPVSILIAPRGSANANFGFRARGTVSGVVFEDLNGDGTQQAIENGLGGVPVTLTLYGGGISTTVTNGGGSYSFGNVPEGSHTVETALPTGFTRTTLGSKLVWLAEWGSASVNFGLRVENTVSGVAFDDRNGNGAQDPGESGIGGVTIWLRGEGVDTALTAGDGSYSFGGVSAGSYIVESDALAGFARTTPGAEVVSVAPLGSASANFGFQDQGTVNGEAFNDTDGDGVKDAGESGIGGVLISLVGSETITTTTLVGGSYSFGGVAEASYTVESELPAGFTRATPGSKVVWVAAGGAAHASFGFQGQGTVSGVAFDDTNGNGARDAGETSMGGILVTLELSGGPVSTMLTTGDGSYRFDDVPAGTHTVETSLPPAFARTTPGSAAIPVTAGGSGHANFGFQGQGYVSGVAFNDTNGNGSKDPGESGIGGVVVSLVGSVVRTSTTVGDGSYSFSDVAEGSYVVETDQPADFVRSSAASIPVWMAPGGSGNADFGFQGQGTLSGVVFDDVNGDGVKQAGENGIAGAEVTLDGKWRLTFVTSGDGRYNFNHIQEGSWTVEAETPAGFARSTPSPVAISVSPGGSANASFGFQGRGTISGVAFDDANGNGVQDAGEAGVGGVLVSLTASLTATTAGDGSYVFGGVPAGAYTIAAADVPGFVQSTPASVGIWLAEGGSGAVNFGYQQAGTIAGVVFADVNNNGIRDAGESGISGVVISGVVISRTTAWVPVTTTSVGNGSYVFAEVADGDHTVSAADLPGFVRTTLGSVHVPVAAGNSGSANFGYQQAGTIAGVVFNDANGNSVLDAGELGIGGVVVAYGSSSTTSAGNGSYLFTSVTEGTYYVSAADAAGFARTMPGSIGVWVTSGGGALANFGYQQVESVGGAAFNDVNGNGSQDPGELGIGGVVMTLTLSTETMTTVSAGNGSYLFTDVTAGSHTASAAGVPGFARSTPGSVLVSVTSEGSTRASFGYRQERTVGGQVFADTNGDGIRQASESGIAGVVISLTGGSGMTDTATAGDGSYILFGVEYGSYTVEETDPTGFGSTTLNVVAVTLSSAEPSASANFGDLAVGVVSGMVFHDLDEDGQLDVGEPGIGGVIVTLNSAGKMLASSIQTVVGSGHYQFDGVGPGVYAVVEADPRGFHSTTPNRVSITILTDGSANANFGDRAGYTLLMPIITKKYPWYGLYIPIVPKNSLP